MSHLSHHYTPTHFLCLQILPKILKRSKDERFYIIKSVSSFYPNPEPVLYILGSFGNEYKLCFSKDTISCSCNYSHSFPCKHILFILLALQFKIKHGGPLLVYPYKLLKLLSEESLSNLFLDSTTDTLCSSHRSNGSLCSLCNHLLEGTLSTCYHCSRSFHYRCVHTIFNCPSCSLPSDFLHSHNIQQHRNFYNILVRRDIHVSKKPTDNSIIQLTNQEGSTQPL